MGANRWPPVWLVRQTWTPSPRSGSATASRMPSVPQQVSRRPWVQTSTWRPAAGPSADGAPGPAPGPSARAARASGTSSPATVQARAV